MSPDTNNTPGMPLLTTEHALLAPLRFRFALAATATPAPHADPPTPPVAAVDILSKADRDMIRRSNRLPAKPRLSSVAQAILAADPDMVGSQPKSLQWWADILFYSSAPNIQRGFRDLVDHGLAKAVPIGKRKHRYVVFLGDRQRAA